MNDLRKDWYTVVGASAFNRPGGRTFWLALAMSLFLLNWYAPACPTPIERILASGIIVLSFGAVWRWLYRGHGEADFGFLPVIMILYSLECALPIFTLKIYSVDGTQHAIAS